MEELLDIWASGDDDVPSRDVSAAQKRRLLKAATWERDWKLVHLAPSLAQHVGEEVFDDHNQFRAEVDIALKKLGEKLPASAKKAILSSASWRSEEAAPVIKKTHKRGTAAYPMKGLVETSANGKSVVVEYEPDTNLRDTEQIPLQEEGGIEAFLDREVVPYAADAWYQADNIKVGYEISFTRHFYKPKPMRPLEEITADILALEQETEGLLEAIIGEAPQ